MCLGADTLAMVDTCCPSASTARPTTAGVGYPGSTGKVGQSNLMRVAIRDAEITDMDDLRRVFERASLSNENDRGLLEEHPELLVLSEVSERADEGPRGRRRHGCRLCHLIGSPTDLRSLKASSWNPDGRGVVSGPRFVLDISARLDEVHFKRLEVTANPHAMAFYERLGFAVDRVVDTPGYPAPRMSRPTRSPH